MTTNDQQITPADAAIVSSGTGTKGPEERDLPASLKEEMDLCLQILREVLGEFDEQLLASFDEVRGYALNASAERFAGILTDTNPDQDDLQNVVNTVDKLDMHDAQLLAHISIWPTCVRRTTESPYCTSAKPPWTRTRPSIR